MSQRKVSQLSPEALQESAKRQVVEVLRTGEDAVSSGAWIYPIKGIIYLLSHPSLLQPMIPTLLKAALTAVGVIAAMFFFTYLPQVAVLALVTGPLAFIGAIPLVLGESYLVLTFLTRTFLVGQAGVDLFDAVLLARNHTELVQKGRLLNPASKANGGKVTQLGRAITKPLSSKLSTDGIIRYVLTLPLNFIPVVGTVFFLGTFRSSPFSRLAQRFIDIFYECGIDILVGYNGLKSGPSYHARYFQLKGWDAQKRREVIKKRRGAYTAFGTVAMALNLIPVVSVFFTLTSSVGAALWASDIENKSSTGGKTPTQAQEQDVSISPISGTQDRAGKKEL
ncbi:hypothetical protein QFC19_000148 [Naganishia cerealis]|uniref:Uncharacterized protein n=1 Tax=Naganishia cerealis TaxID=610337 RepID=A0ACC2WSE3_9TREE|nr:hypothetical protein QFC19_000148 [Naganishia cerealis]